MSWCACRAVVGVIVRQAIVRCSGILRYRTRRMSCDPCGDRTTGGAVKAADPAYCRIPGPQHSILDEQKSIKERPNPSGHQTQKVTGGMGSVIGRSHSPVTPTQNLPPRLMRSQSDICRFLCRELSDRRNNETPAEGSVGASHRSPPCEHNLTDSQEGKGYKIKLQQL